MMHKVKNWLKWHEPTKHLLVPIWVRIPEKHRWTIASWLNKSRRYCWSSLVDAAFCHHEDDACDRKLPLPHGGGEYCRSHCSVFEGVPGHENTHLCECYCGKFQFRAESGSGISATPTVIGTPWSG